MWVYKGRIEVSKETVGAAWTNCLAGTDDFGGESSQNC